MLLLTHVLYVKDNYFPIKTLEDNEGHFACYFDRSRKSVFNEDGFKYLVTNDKKGFFNHSIKLKIACISSNELIALLSK
jgi:hypothetical protein